VITFKNIAVFRYFAWRRRVFLHIAFSRSLLCTGGTLVVLSLWRR